MARQSAWFATVSSVDTSMGMTPLEGLMMGTRSGDVDFGAMSWVASQTNQSLGDLTRSE